MKFINYLKDIRGEMQLVKWPTKKQAISFTAVVIIICVVVAIALGFFDIVFTKGFGLFAI